MDICDGPPNHSYLCAPDLLARTVDVGATLAKVETVLVLSAECKPRCLLSSGLTGRLWTLRRLLGRGGFLGTSTS